MDPALTDLITPRLGRIVHVQPTTGGNSYATTAVITGRDERVFIKAVPNRPGGLLDEVEREGQVNPYLNRLAPALRWQVHGNGWFVLGFEVIDARPTDFTPSSPDLPRLVEVMDRILDLPLPDVAYPWAETRWDRALSPEEIEVVSGDYLTHADLHPRNVVVDRDDRLWVIDWAWPTRASAVVTPSCLAVQLVAAGHSPIEVEKLFTASARWGYLDRNEITVFARAQVRMNRFHAKRRPEEKCLGAMAEAASIWSKHCAG